MLTSTFLSMMSVSALKRIMAAKKSTVTRQINAIKAILNESEPNTSDVEAAKNVLQTRYEAYYNAHDKYFEALVAENNEEDVDAAQQLHDTYEMEYMGVLDQARKSAKINPNPGNPPPEHTPMTSLSRLKVPTFGGDLMEWPAFWLKFEPLVVNNRHLQEHERLMYLEEALGNEPLKTIRGLLNTGASFTKIIKTLKDRYDDNNVIVDTLCLRLIHLKAPSYQLESLIDFRAEYHNLTGALENRVDLAAAHYMIRAVLASKIPREVRDQLCSYHKTNHHTVSEIVEGIEIAIKNLSIAPQSMASNPINSQGQTQNYREGKLHQHKPSQKSILPKPSNLKGAVTVAQGTTSYKRSCLYCNAEHRSRECNQYAGIAARKARLKQLGRCQNCVSPHHVTSDCKTVLKVCFNCGESGHHVALCCKPPPQRENSQKHFGACAAHSEVINKCVALPTATADILIGKKLKYTGRVFFDQGAQCTVMSEKLARQLQLKPKESARVAVSGLISDRDYTDYPVVHVKVRLGPQSRKIAALIMDRAAAVIRVPGLTNVASHLQKAGVELADKYLTSDSLDNIGLTIGGDYYGDFITSYSKRMGIHLCKTAGGYMIQGALRDHSSRSLQHQTLDNRISAHRLVLQFQQSLTNYENVKELSSNNAVECEGGKVGEPDHHWPVSQLWNLDVIGVKPNATTPEEVLSYDHYVESVQYRDGQYWVRLPLKPNARPLPTNYSLAKSQLETLRSRLQKTGHLQDYHELIQKQLQENFIEIVENAIPHKQSHYLPHRAVFKQSASTPMRMVFNASAKTGSHPSLNDNLLTGPTLTSKLGDTLLRFRTCRYGFSADISKAFLRIGLQGEDRDLTRFLWLEDPHNPSSDLITYRFRSVLFGATCSPFLLQATIESHLNHSKDPFAAYLKKAFYVDNLQGTSDRGEFLCHLHEAANRLMQEANMPLRQWVSNCPTLLERLALYDPEYECPAQSNLLGLDWHINLDNLAVRKPSWPEETLTRRSLLSRVSQVFDPLGLITPVTIRGRMLVKEAWKVKGDWDSPLTPPFLDEWEVLEPELQSVDELLIPRAVAVEDAEYDLHIFCDASGYAYGAACYVQGVSRGHLLTSRARVTPMEARSLPQMELTAIELGCRLASYVLDVLNHITFRNKYIWSDNEAALCWVRNDSSNKPYVRNRVASIRELATGYTFQHVGGKENPADLLTRGMTTCALKNSELWWSGPPWLAQRRDWPEQKTTVISVHSLLVLPQPEPLIIDPEKFSSLGRLLRVTGFVFQFANNLKTDWIKLDPLQYLLKQDQEYYYLAERYKLLGKALPENVRPTMIQTLGLYLDARGLIRCRGRIQNVTFKVDTEPVLLARKSSLTRLIIMQAHLQTHHGGVAETLAHLRENFWLPKGRQVVKSTLYQCYVCRVLTGRPFQYPGPPALPPERVVHNHPFHTTGVDYAGPITIATVDREDKKYYVCLFTCASSRAIHLELARDLSASTFLHVFRRFISRRSCPKIIISDNGTAFRATAKVLGELQCHPEVTPFLTNRGITWRFNPPGAPWHGGFFERLVGLTKGTLRKALYRKSITEEELITVLSEVEQHLNNRPLTYIDDDLNHPSPLTPAHLLYGRRLESHQIFDIADQLNADFAEQSDLNVALSRVSSIISKWKEIWEREYINSLREKFYGAQVPHNGQIPQVGDVVLVVAGGPRSQWSLGRIASLLPDARGVIRLARVTVRDRALLKTIDKLIPLESSPSVCEEVSVPNTQEDSASIVDTRVEAAPSSRVSDVRPRRRAALKASSQRRELIEASLL